jgi:hypothetical protein
MPPAPAAGSDLGFRPLRFGFLRTSSIPRRRYATLPDDRKFRCLQTLIATFAFPRLLSVMNKLTLSS